MLCLWPLRKACAAGGLWNFQQYTVWLVPAGPNPTSKALAVRLSLEHVRLQPVFVKELTDLL